MKSIATLLMLASAMVPAHAAQACPATENALLGTWSNPGHDGFFELFALDDGGGRHLFNSWLHQRPDLIDAAWKLDHCQLIVEPQDGIPEIFHFRILDLSHGKLRLYDETDHTVSVYVRVPDDT